MLIWGTRSKVVEGPVMRGHSCAKCGQGEYESFGLLRYFHVFWIPVFPFSRTVGVQCTHCKHTTTGDDVPGAFRDTIRDSVFTRGAVLPLFTGSVLIAAFVGVGVVSSQRDQQLETEYLQTPLANDVYIMDFSRVFENVDNGYKYGVMRVELVDDAEIELSVSNYSYNRSYIPSSDLARDMSAEDFFSEETVVIPRDKLAELKADATIRDVRRGL